ncbi:MAG: NAD-dependent dehydratase, partial [Betaproteobacteria bacterium HGW-Betaproteobacteria-21]
MKVLVTGGAGFIGTRTSAALVAEGHVVRVLDCLDPQIHGSNADFPLALSSIAECVRGDVCNLADCVAGLEGVEAVIHLAARTGVGQSMYDLADYVETNVRGTATLVEAIIKSRASLRRVVLASSRAVYGEGMYVCRTHGYQHPATRDREAMESGRFEMYCCECSEA